MNEIYSPEVEQQLLLDLLAGKRVAADILLDYLEDVGSSRGEQLKEAINQWNLYRPLAVDRGELWYWGPEECVENLVAKVVAKVTPLNSFVIPRAVFLLLTRGNRTRMPSGIVYDSFDDARSDLLEALLNVFGFCQVIASLSVEGS